MAKFYDVESGRNSFERRGTGNAHQQFDIPIPRDGGIADLLAEAKRPDRRFVAVVCESIERVARTTYFSTKIEYELEQAGIALLAADEGIDPSAVPGLNDGAAPFRRATPTLTRRIKQAIAEWYVLNMLELSWGGTKAHTDQGFNIGKPPYGYTAGRTRHPVKVKAEQGKVKHRLAPDPARGPVVTQIFLWRALERLSYQAIADRLNLEPERYPPPEPILGQGRRRVGAWTLNNVREVLDNPKQTGEFQPVEVRQMMIPKGNSGKFRKLGIPTGTANCAVALVSWSFGIVRHGHAPVPPAGGSAVAGAVRAAAGRWAGAQL